MSLIDKNVEKVLDVLLDHPNVGYSKKELAEEAEISRSTLYRIWNDLEGLGIVREKKRYGGTVLYRLNSDSELVNELGKILDAQKGVSQTV